MSAGQDFRAFWHTPLREISLVLKGHSARLRREHNDRAWVAWHTARLTAYPPEKPSAFVPLSKLQITDKPKAAQAPNWERSFEAFAGWVKSFKR